jgi:hypothetical protein
MLAGVMDKDELMRRVRAGEYVVDPYAVAGAMLERRHVRQALLGSEVFEPAEVERLAPGTDEPDPPAGPDPA